MFTFLTLLFRSRHAEGASRRTAPSPAAALMQSAGARAGTNAHQAQELRSAASAWLSVIR